jgi:NADH-quinone oxidoreductase subunit N
MNIFIFKAFWPELFLSFSIISLLIFNSSLINNLKFNYPIINNEIFYQNLTILLFLFILISNNNIFGYDYNFFFVHDLTTKIIKLFFIGFCLISFVIIWRSFVLQKLNFFEYFIIYLIAILALLFLVNAFNLISIYLCLELQSISFYVLATFHRASILSSEAGLKYFISSSLLSGTFLLGCVFLYGSLGTLDLHNINILTTTLLSESYLPILLVASCGIFFIIATLLFKLVIAPFHVWFPQIYDGSPLSSTIIFSMAPKVVFFSLLIKIWSSVAVLLSFSKTTLFLIGAFSIVFGLIKLLKQKRLKKLYIYSSISQMGLPICALVDNSLNSFATVYFFLIIYLITSLLIWGSFVIINSNQNKIEKLIENNIKPLYLSLFSNLVKNNSTLAYLLFFIFFSLGAIPPLSGFISKIFIYLILIEDYKNEIAALIIYISVFGVYYYIKFLKIVFFENIIITSHAKAQSLFPMKYLTLESHIYSFALFLLVFLCLNPNILYLNCLLLAFHSL